MRFDFNAYEKVFPTQTVPQEVETAVDGFNPTAEKLTEKAKDEKPGEQEPKQKEPELPAEDPGRSEDDPPEGV